MTAGQRTAYQIKVYLQVMKVVYQLAVLESARTIAEKRIEGSEDRRRG